MSSIFSLVEPLTIDDTMFATSTDNDLVEPDTRDGAIWVTGTTYAIGARRYYEHAIWQRLTAGAGSTVPRLDPTNWVYVSPTNRWAMLDSSNSTQTTAPNGLPGSFSFHIFLPAGTAFDTIVLDNIDEAASIKVQAWNSTETVKLYEQTVTLRDSDPTRAWVAKRTAVFLAIPNDAGGTVLVFSVVAATPGSVIYGPDAFYTGSVPAIGTLVIGVKRELGTAVSGFATGIIDRSGKSTDDFGNVSVVDRGFSKRMNGSVAVNSTDVDGIVNLLARYRAIPAMYMCTDGTYASMVMLAFYKSFDVTVEGPNLSYCAVDIEGL